MVGRRCAVKSCERDKVDKDGQLRYFRFPNPKTTSVDTIWRWKLACGRVEILNIDADTLYRNYRICSLHFNPQDVNNRLSHNAVPIYHIGKVRMEVGTFLNPAFFADEDVKPDINECAKNIRTPMLSIATQTYLTSYANKRDAECQANPLTSSAEIQTARKLLTDLPRERKLRAKLTENKREILRLKKENRWLNQKIKILKNRG